MPDTHILAILLILASAVMHMAWNMLLKQCTDRLVSIWLFLLVGVIVFLPFGVLLGDTTVAVTGFQVAMFALSGFLKAVYFVLLGYLYETGDFSKAYPIARAAHVFVPFLAFVFLGEPLRPLVLFGVFILWIGILFVNMPRLHTDALQETLSELRGSHSLFALLTAAIVALYSIVDTAAVADMDPLLFLPLMFFSCLVFLGLHIVRVRTPQAIAAEWQRHWSAISGIALLNFGGYLLVLFAMGMTSVSIVVSVRQVSIVLAVAAGHRLYQEPAVMPRLVGASFIVGGIIVVSLF